MFDAASSRLIYLISLIGENISTLEGPSKYLTNAENCCVLSLSPQIHDTRLITKFEFSKRLFKVIVESGIFI